jgi:ribosomal protein S27AE
VSTYPQPDDDYRPGGIDWALVRAGCPRCGSELQHHRLTWWCLRCGAGSNWSSYVNPRYHVPPRSEP